MDKYFMFRLPAMIDTRAIRTGSLRMEIDLGHSGRKLTEKTEDQIQIQVTGIVQTKNKII